MINTEASIKFSIIVPCYNVESYIRQCVESVQKQTYPNWELILVDDESTDDTLQILYEFSQEDSRIKTISKEHGGLPQTRNIGMKHITGNYLMLLDGDDFFAIDHLEREAKILQEIECDMLIHNQHTNFVEECYSKVVLFPPNNRVLTSEEKLDYLFEMNHFLPASAVLSTYNVDFLNMHNLTYGEQYSCSEDLDFFYKVISKNPRIEFAYYEFYFYRQDNFGAMTKNLTAQMELDRLSIYKKWFDEFEGKSIGSFDGKIIQKRISNDLIEQLFLISTMEREAWELVIEYLKKNKYLFIPNGIFGSFEFLYYIRIPYRRFKTCLKGVYQRFRVIKMKGILLCF